MNAVAKGHCLLETHLKIIVHSYPWNHFLQTFPLLDQSPNFYTCAQLNLLDSLLSCGVSHPYCEAGARSMSHFSFLQLPFKLAMKAHYATECQMWRVLRALWIDLPFFIRVAESGNWHSTVVLLKVFAITSFFSPSDSGSSWSRKRWISFLDSNYLPCSILLIHCHVR